MVVATAAGTEIPGITLERISGQRIKRSAILAGHLIVGVEDEDI